MSGFLELFSQYDVLGAFLVNIELTLWSALFSLILGVILVVMRISPISSLRAVAGAYVELFKPSARAASAWPIGTVLMPERSDSHTNAAVYRLRPVTASQKKFVAKVSEKLSFSCA